MSNWSPWTVVPNGSAAPFSPVTAAETDLFVVGTDRRIYTTSWDGAGFSGWVAISDGEAELLSPVTAVHPFSVANGGCDVNRVHVFVVGLDTQIYTAERDGERNWSAWAPLGPVTAPLRSEVTATKRGEGEIDIATVEVSRRVCANTWRQGAWTGWTSHGSTQPSTKVAAVIRAERLNLFMTDGSGNVDSIVGPLGDSGWGEWFRVHDGQVNLGSPVTAYSVDEATRMDVFVVDPEGNVAWIFYRNGWLETWRHVGVEKRRVWGAPITAVSRNPNDLVLLSPGDDGLVYQVKWTANGVWEAEWTPVAGVTVGARSQIGAVARDANTVAAFVVDNQGNIQTATLTQ